MALRWSDRRKLLYSGVAGVIALVALIFIYETFFTFATSCFNGRQDGSETGVDCGGTCALICAASAHQPTVLWTRAFNVGGNYYTAAVYIHNPNTGAGAKQVHYFFQLFDANNSLVKEQDGVVDLPPVQTIPVIEPNIDVGNRTVAHTLFTFSDPNITWVKVPAGPALTMSQQNLAADGSRLSATLTDESLTDAKNITVVAVLFDGDGIARAASKSIIAGIPAKSSVPVVFTWPGGVRNIVKAEISVLPSF